MKKVLCFIALGFSFSLNAQATVIDLTTSNNQVSLGNEFTLNIDISGLDNSNPSALGVYDINLNYDSNLFAVKSIQFGDSTKGNQLDLNHYGSLQTNTLGDGWINLFELSLDAADDLNQLQANDFRLLSVIFTALEQGSGVFSLDTNSLGDAFGNNLWLDNINNTSVNVTDVPEPAGLALIGLGLLALGSARLNRKV